MKGQCQTYLHLQEPSSTLLSFSVSWLVWEVALYEVGQAVRPAGLHLRSWVFSEILVGGASKAIGQQGHMALYPIFNRLRGVAPYWGLLHRQAFRQ